jgi:hypothetical protein
MECGSLLPLSLSELARALITTTHGARPASRPGESKLPHSIVRRTADRKNGGPRYSLWKNTDPDIPILKQAQAEYAGLK